MEITNLDTFNLCLNCVEAYAGYDVQGEAADRGDELDAEPLTKVQGWVLSHVEDENYEPLEPHFSWGACDGCETKLGGDRYVYNGFKLKWKEETCNCPCGCDVPQLGGTCDCCGNGEHQNNANLPEYSGLVSDKDSGD